MWPNSLSMVICLYNQVLAEGCPQGVIVEGFLGPQQLASIFTHAILNVHTAPYEAYGMTIVEAAAFGAPSVVHDKDIGACELLPRAAPRGSSVGLGSEAKDIASVWTLVPDLMRCAIRQHDHAVKNFDASCGIIQRHPYLLSTTRSGAEAVASISAPILAVRGWPWLDRRRSPATGASALKR